MIERREGHSRSLAADEQTRGASLNHVGERLGLSLETLAELQSMGVFICAADGQVPPPALERLRLLKFVLDRGVTLEDVRLACEAEGDLLRPFVDLVGEPRSLGRSLVEGADLAGLDVGTARRLWSAAGFGENDEVFAPDVEMLAILSLDPPMILGDQRVGE